MTDHPKIVRVPNKYFFLPGIKGLVLNACFVKNDGRDLVDPCIVRARRKGEGTTTHMVITQYRGYVSEDGACTGRENPQVPRVAASGEIALKSGAMQGAERTIAHLSFFSLFPFLFNGGVDRSWLDVL